MASEHSSWDDTNHTLQLQVLQKPIFHTSHILQDVMRGLQCGVFWHATTESNKNTHSQISSVGHDAATGSEMSLHQIFIPPFVGVEADRGTMTVLSAMLAARKRNGCSCVKASVKNA